MELGLPSVVNNHIIHVEGRMRHFTQDVERKPSDLKAIIKTLILRTTGNERAYRPASNGLAAPRAAREAVRKEIVIDQFKVVWGPRVLIAIH
jgi:hypothetical protein